MKLVYPVLSVLALAAWPLSAPAAEPLVCNLNALTPAERERYQTLTERLSGAVVDREELTNGYALVLNPSRLPITEIAEWVTLEARCCPFLDFGIDVRGKDGSVKLRLTGGKGVKAFLKEELDRAPRAGFESPKFQREALYCPAET